MRQSPGTAEPHKAAALRAGRERSRIPQVVTKGVAMVAMKAADRRRRQQARRDRGSGIAPGEIVKTVREGVAGAARQLADQARSVSRQAKEATTEVSRAVMQTVREEGERLYQKKKGKAVARVQGVAKIGRQAAHALHAVKADKAAEYVEDAARRVGEATGYLEDHTLTEIIEDAADVVRRNQTLAVGGLFVAGFALTRFLKASASRGEEGEASAGVDVGGEDAASDEWEGDEGQEQGEEDEQEGESGDDIESEYDQDQGDEQGDEDDGGAEAQDEAEAGDEEREYDETEEEDEAPAARRRPGGSSRDRARERGRPARR
jgi:hypothetical protein